MATDSHSLLRVRRRELTWREVDGEVIALDLVSSTYFTTNATGAHLWRALVDGATFADLVAELQAKFGVSVDTASTDARAFVTLLDNNGLLETAA